MCYLKEVSLQVLPEESINACVTRKKYYYMCYPEGSIRACDSLCKYQVMCYLMEVSVHLSPKGSISAYVT